MDNYNQISQEELFNQQKRCVGSWSFDQNLLYVIFLQKNKAIMVSKKKKRNLRVFDLMSEFINSRNPLQCRSHHQKLLQKFGEVKSIISHLKKYISKEQYKNKFQQISGELRVSNEKPAAIEQVKEDDLHQQRQQQIVKVQDSAPVIMDNRIEQFQKFYNLYMLQMANHINSLRQISYCYPETQFMP